MALIDVWSPDLREQRRRHSRTSLWPQTALARPERINNSRHGDAICSPGRLPDSMRD